MCVSVWVCVVSCVGREAEIQTNLWSVLENGAISWYTQQDKDLDKLGQTEKEKERGRERKRKEWTIIFYFLFSHVSKEMLWASSIRKGSLSLAV